MARTKRKVNPIAPAPDPVVSVQAAYRTAAYVRLSIEDGGKPGADTLNGQQYLLESYIESQPNMMLTEIYCDNGRTGTNFERPAFERLMEDLKSGKVNCIVVKDLSRFGRNYKESGNLLERVFPFLGVRFIAINDNFDTLTAERNEYGFVVPLKNLINETYSRDISKKSSSAIESIQRRGEFRGTWAPYGYSKSSEDKHKLVVNEETAPIVRQIFSLRLKGIGYEQIARMLNEQGVLSPAGYLTANGLTTAEKYRNTFWRAWNIKEILSRSVYLGHLVQGKRTQAGYKQARTERYAPESEWRVVHNTHEAIIDEKTFQQAQDLAEERKTAYQDRLYKNGSVKTPNLFRRLVYCADCGKALSRTHLSCYRQGEKYFYYSYVCLTARSMSSACTRKNLSEEELLAVVSEQIHSHLATITALEDSVTAAFHNKTTSKIHLLSKEIFAAEQELTRQKGLHDGLYQSLVDGVLSQQEYAAMKDSFLKRCIECENHVDKLREQMQELKRYSPQNPIFTALREFQKADHLTEELIHALISRIEYSDNNQIEIFFTYQNELTRLSQFAKGGPA